MTAEQISKQKLECLRFALQVPANQKDYLATSFGNQPQLPRAAKSTAEILKDAETIFEWISKQ